MTLAKFRLVSYFSDLSSRSLAGNVSVPGEEPTHVRPATGQASPKQAEESPQSSSHVPTGQEPRQAQ